MSFPSGQGYDQWDETQDPKNVLPQYLEAQHEAPQQNEYKRQPPSLQQHGSRSLDGPLVLETRLRSQYRVNYEPQAQARSAAARQAGPIANAIAVLRKAKADEREPAPKPVAATAALAKPARRVQQAEPRATARTSRSIYDDPPLDAHVHQRGSADYDTLVATIASLEQALDEANQSEAILKQQNADLSAQLKKREDYIDEHEQTYREILAEKDNEIATVEELLTEMTDAFQAGLLKQKELEREMYALTRKNALLEEQIKAMSTTTAGGKVRLSSEARADVQAQLQNCQAMLAQAHEAIDTLVKHREVLVQALDLTADGWDDEVKDQVQAMLDYPLPDKPRNRTFSLGNPWSAAEQAENRLTRRGEVPPYTGGEGPEPTHPKVRRALALPASDPRLSASDTRSDDVFVVEPTTKSAPPPPPPPRAAASKPPPPPPPPPPAPSSASAFKTYPPRPSASGPSTPSPTKKTLLPFPPRPAAEDASKARKPTKGSVAPDTEIQNELKARMERRRHRIAPDDPIPTRVVTAAEPAWLAAAARHGDAARAATGSPDSTASAGWNDGSPEPAPEASKWDPPAGFKIPHEYAGLPVQIWGPAMCGPSGVITGILTSKDLQVHPLDINKLLTFKRLGASERIDVGILPHGIPPNALRFILGGRTVALVLKTLWTNLYAFTAGGSLGEKMRKELEVELNPWHSEASLRKDLPAAKIWKQFVPESVVEGMTPRDWRALVASDDYWQTVFDHMPANARKPGSRPAAASSHEEGEEHEDDEEKD